MLASTMAWLENPPRHATTASRFYAAALKTHLSPAQAAAVTACVFRAQAHKAPAFAARWRRAACDPGYVHARAA